MENEKDIPLTIYEALSGSLVFSSSRWKSKQNNVTYMPNALEAICLPGHFHSLYDIKTDSVGEFLQTL